MQPAFLGKLVDDAPFLGFARAERRSGENNVERLLDADETRQALGAARAGNKSELDLGQAAFGGRHGDPIMRRQRDLKSSAERGSVQRGDDRLRRVLDPIEDVRKIGRGGRLAELGDVGAGDKGSPGANDHDRLDRVVRLCCLHASLQAVANRLGQRVDRRGVDRDGRDVSVDRELGDGIDGGHRFPPASARRTRDLMGRTARWFSASQRPGTFLKQAASSGQLPCNSPLFRAGRVRRRRGRRGRKSLRDCVTCPRLGRTGEVSKWYHARLSANRRGGGC